MYQKPPASGLHDHDRLLGEAPSTLKCIQISSFLRYNLSSPLRSLRIHTLCPERSGICMLFPETLYASKLLQKFSARKFSLACRRSRMVIHAVESTGIYIPFLCNNSLTRPLPVTYNRYTKSTVRLPKKNLKAVVSSLSVSRSLLVESGSLYLCMTSSASRGLCIQWLEGRKISENRLRKTGIRQGSTDSFTLTIFVQEVLFADSPPILLATTDTKLKFGSTSSIWAEHDSKELISLFLLLECPKNIYIQNFIKSGLC